MLTHEQGAHCSQSRDLNHKTSTRFILNKSQTMPFIDLNKHPTLNVAPGCRLRTPHGENLMLSYVEMEESAEIPLHDHPHEQGGVVLSGTLRLTIGEETRAIGPGEMYLIPPNVPHRAIAEGGPAVVMDVFSPIREDYIEKTRAAEQIT